MSGSDGRVDVPMGPWQRATIAGLVELLQPDPLVRALIVFGSVTESEADAWSDIDLLLVVEEPALSHFFPSTAWLHPIGELYAWDQSSGEFTTVTRACFRDLRRLDFVITTEPALDQVESWPSVPFWKGAHVLFSRSPRIDRLLAQSFDRPVPPLITPDEFQEMVNRFWFKGALAVTKVVRNDLLIALHLALEMVQDCCVLGMLLRDRSEGTAHHRHGGTGNAVAAHLEATRFPHTPAGILNCLEQTALAFDALAAQWSPTQQPKHEPLLSWIAAARRALSESQG